jgi:1-acyl-sn-glycerol-3-phosphate acyltransferase
MWPAFALRREGVENIPEKSAYLLLCKHQRWEDIPLLSLVTPRPLYYIAKAELFENPLAGWFLQSLGGIPLNRKRPLESRRHLNSALCFLQAGAGAVVFPEGTYYRDQMGPGKPGMIRWILTRIDIPVIPVGIRYRRNRRRTSVWIRFGKPLVGKGAVPVDDLLCQTMREIARLSGFPTGTREEESTQHEPI